MNPGRRMSTRLQQAAEMLRQRATAATPGPWQMDGPFWWRGGDANPDCTYLITAGDERLPVVILPEDRDRRPTSNADAELVATMSPPVALALAALLEAQDEQNRRDDMERRRTGWYGRARILTGVEGAASGVARAILGDAA